MTREEFIGLVERAMGRIPRRFRDAMRNIALVVEDAPSDELLDEMDVEPGATLFGLYQGVPLTERSWADGNRLPDRITLYQEPIEEDCETHEDVVACVTETLIHEVGHYFGLSEEQIEEIEERFWRDRSEGA